MSAAANVTKDIVLLLIIRKDLMIGRQTGGLEDVLSTSAVRTT